MGLTRPTGLFDHLGWEAQVEWCAERDSNPHGLAATSPSSWRVYLVSPSAQVPAEAGRVVGAGSGVRTRTTALEGRGSAS